MNIFCKTSGLVAIIACLFSCSSPNELYKTEKLSSSGYSQYKTYAFLPTADTSYTKMFDKKKLESLMSTAAIKELSKKGMKLDTINPDCFFSYKLIANRAYSVAQQQNVVYNPDVFVPAFDNDARIYTFSSDNKPVVYNGNISVDTLREGSLVVDMIDRKQGNVIWRSTASAKTKETFQQPSPERINYIIRNMFKSFPRK
jgi:hypothetical protein